MAVYGNMVITQAGQTLYGKVQTGTTLTFTRMQIGSGQRATQLTTALTSGTQYTTLSVQALPAQITSGDTILIGAGSTTQSVTASATAASGATSISVNSFTANSNYATGSPVIDTTVLSALTALVTPIDYVTINAVSSSSGTANVRGIYQNTNLTQSTYTCEIGLFAQDPTAGEILYAYANAGSQGDTIPPYADGPYSRQYQINTAVGNATSVTANIPANTYIPTTQIGAANGVAPLDANSKVPAANLPAMSYIPTSSEGVANGVATTDANNKVAQTANQSDKLSTARTISLSGDATGSTPFDGSANEAISVTLANSGVAAGTYPKVTVDAKGRVTAGSGLASTDVTNALGFTPLSTTGTAANSNELNGQPASYYATASQANSSASGTWTPANGALNVAIGTVINVASVPSGAKNWTVINKSNGALSLDSAIGVSTTSSGSAWVVFESGSSYSEAQLGYTSSTSQSSVTGSTINIWDGSTLARGYYQINGSYLQFVVTSTAANSTTATNLVWGVS